LVDGEYVDFGGGVVHFPRPLEVLSRLELSAALGKPEFGRDVRVDERVEHLADRSTDEHLGLGGDPMVGHVG
jgi:hypothetical protein